MPEDEHTLTIEELAERAETSVRTIRFYIAEGLLSGPGARGKAASYSGDHLLRLRLIRRLAEQRVPLAEMRAMLARLSPEEAQALLAEEEERAMQREQAAQAPSPKEYLATLLQQAREARQPPASQMKAAPASPASSIPPARLYQRPVNALPSQPADVWQRWELAPGVELHVKADVADQQRRLIERLLWAAGAPDQKPR
ncbi:MAG TPA: MerR family transcriptional regulator [Ktedonobacterales bacterium]|nr:MerR family transcriptional regulator [Ktedonobacterales bacterium]